MQKFDLWTLMKTIDIWYVRGKTNDLFFKLKVERNGKVCLVRCHQQIRENPPSSGSIITVKHFGIYSNGTLKNPFYWRQRKDLL
jgi:hypothetical protein